MGFFVDRAMLKIKQLGFKPKILFTEGWNKEIQKAVLILKKENIIEPILLVKDISELNKDLNNIHTIVIDKIEKEKYINKMYELRKHKNLSYEQACKLAIEPNFLSALMLKLDEVNGVVCGIEYTTKDTIRAALQIIKPRPDTKIISSVFLFEKDNDTLIFSDCALNINPNSEELACIAKNAILFARDTLLYPNLNTALLSYSTNGSGAGESVDKVKAAYEIIKNSADLKDVNIFGEIQFDAAYSKNVREKKVKNLNWDKSAEIYIFPNIDSGNIASKIMDWCGKYLTIGPIVIGLDKPMNDLSRGASADSVAVVAYITAAQIYKYKK